MTFQEKYYKNRGGMEIQDKALTIGGYKSAWLADLIAAHVLENTQQHFQIMKHFGIYSDGGICITKEIMTKNEPVKWPNDFQISVNKLIDGNYL